MTIWSVSLGKQFNIFLGAPGKTRHPRGLSTVSRAADTGVSLQGLLNISGGYLQQRKRLVALILRCVSALRVAQEVAHTAVSASFHRLFDLPTCCRFVLC